MACDWLSALSLRGMVSPGEETDVELEKTEKLEPKDFLTYFLCNYCELTAHPVSASVCLSVSPLSPLPDSS